MVVRIILSLVCTFIFMQKNTLIPYNTQLRPKHYWSIWSLTMFLKTCLLITSIDWVSLMYNESFIDGFPYTQIQYTHIHKSTLITSVPISPHSRTPTTLSCTSPPIQWCESVLPLCCHLTCVAGYCVSLCPTYKSDYSLSMYPFPFDWLHWARYPLQIYLW